MNGKLGRPLNWLLVVLVNVAAFSGRAQLPQSSTQVPTTQPQALAAQQEKQQSVQVISQTNLLPVFALDMPLDIAWVDGKDVPSKSAQFSHDGVNDTLQLVWDALKPSGFNALRFPVEVTQPGAAARVANLCLWAKANNVKIILILQSATDDKKTTPALAQAAELAKFPRSVVSRLRDAQQIAAYAQISFFQIADAMNHAGTYPQTNPDTAQPTLLSAGEALRKSEAQALEGTGLQATPIMISASFDYELIRQGAIAGVPLDSVAEQKAEASLKQFLKPLASGSNIEAVNLEWFPRSISAGDVDRFAGLIREVHTALPDKQVTLTTGFSTAFNPADQQMQFFVLAFTNLVTFRASDGGSSYFLGAVFRQALQGQSADGKERPGSSDPSQWNWSEKAQQLWKMWSEGKKSAELTWWLNKVQDHMGLLALQTSGSGETSVVPLPAAQAFQQISATVAQVNQTLAPQVPVPGANSSGPMVSPAAISQTLTPANAMGVQPFIPPAANSGALAYPAAAQGTPQSGLSAYQQMLLNILQQVSSQLSSALVARFANTPGQGSQGQFSGYSPGVLPQNPGASMPPQQSAYGPPNYGSTPPVSQGTSASGGGYGMPASTPLAVSFGPQDVTIDSTNPRVGQPVHITALIHNLSANQDISGLAVLLVDPSNPVSPNQALQNGVAVPRSGTTPVQLTWIAGQASTSPFQMSLQVLDASGLPMATSTLPVIRVTGTSSSANAAPSQSTSAVPQTAIAPAIQAAGPAILPAQQAGTQPIVVPQATIPLRPVPGSGMNVPAPNTALPLRPGTPSVSASVAPSSGSPVRPGTTQAVATSGISTGIPVRPGASAINTSPLTTGIPGTAATAVVNGVGAVDLAVSTADIQLNPSPPQPGQPTTFTALIHNLGVSAAQGALVSFKLVTDCGQLAVSQPIVFNIAGHGTFKAVWKTPVLACQGREVVVSVTANGDVNAANNQAILWLTAPQQNTKR